MKTNEAKKRVYDKLRPKKRNYDDIKAAYENFPDKSKLKDKF